jgi:hypothetical protein
VIINSANTPTSFSLLVSRLAYSTLKTGPMFF